MDTVGEDRVEWRKQHRHTYTTMCKTDSWWEVDILHREPSLSLCFFHQLLTYLLIFVPCALWFSGWTHVSVSPAGSVLISAKRGVWGWLEGWRKGNVFSCFLWDSYSLLVCLYVLWTFSSVQSHSCVRLFATPWTEARQASLSITTSQSLLKLMSIESMMPSSHLILCHPLLFLPSILPGIRVFSNESVLRIRWPKYWSFSVSISPSSEY